MGFPRLVFRAERKMETNELQDYVNSFVTLVDTEDEADFYEHYRYVDLQQRSVEGFSVFRNGIMPMTEDEEAAGCVRVRMRSLPSDICNCFDFLLEQLVSGFLASEDVLGIEFKPKGDLVIYYIWTRKEKGQEIRDELVQKFADVRIDIEELTW